MNRYCPTCGMRYRTRDGVIYPQSHNLNDECDACHLEAVMNNITSRKRGTVHSLAQHYCATKQGSGIMIQERKQRLIASVSETLGSFSLSRQEIGTVIDLISDVEVSEELLEDVYHRDRAKRGRPSWASDIAHSDSREQKVLEEARQRLADYLSNLGPEKRHDLMAMMYLGRNLDYYGLCQEAVVEFKLRSQDGSGHYDAEELAKHSHLKEWLRLVLELVEA